MSEYQAPSDFLDESQNGEYFGELSNLDAFYADYFSQGGLQENLLNPAVPPPIDAGHAFDGQDPLPDLLDDGNLSGDQIQAGPPESKRLQSEQNNSFPDRNDNSIHPRTGQDSDSLNKSEPGGIHSHEEQQSEYESGFLDEYQWDVSRLPESIPRQDSVGYAQQDLNMPSESDRHGLEANKLVLSQEDLSLIQETDPTVDLRGGNDGPQFDRNDFRESDTFGENFPGLQLNTLSKEWQDIAKNAENRSLEDILGIGVEEEQQTVRNREEGQKSHPKPANRQFGAADHVSDAQGNFGTSSNQAQDASDEESESSSSSDPVRFDTFMEHDPLVVSEDPHRGWGRVGNRNGHEVWFNPKTSKWQPSASHHDMRATLIAKAQAEYPNDRYLHPDPTDGLPHGETAFFKPHQNRGPNRNQCADELFVWREYKPKKDDRGKLLRKSKPKYSIRNHPGYMYEEDKILLDPHNNPVVNHKFIPLTLSAHTDGGKLQEMALQPGCKQIDLWARMPRWEKKTNKNGQIEIIALRDKNTRINMPMTRFREKKGTIAGGDREGTETIMDGLRRFYHHHEFDPVASGHSVKAFPRDLEPWEVKEVRLGNTARFGGRAGNRALDDAKREANYQKTLKAIENGKKRQAPNEEDGTRKRGREDDVAASPASDAGPRKRRRGAQDVDPGVAAMDEGSTGRQGAPNFRNGLDDGFEGTFHQQGEYYQTSRPLQAHPNPYAPSLPPNQRPSFQTPSMATPNLSNFQRNHRGMDNSVPAQNRPQQPPYGGLKMQAVRNPYENAQVETPLNNSLLNSQYYPGHQYSQVNAIGQRNPTSMPGQTQQPPHNSNHDQPLGTGRQAMAQNGTGPPLDRGYSFPGGHYGAGDQRKRHFEGADSAPQRPVNTVAPGGRRPTQMPEQVLGKRRNRDALESTGAEDQGFNLVPNEGRRAPVAPSSNYGPRTPATRNGTSQGPPSLQTHQDPDFVAAHKRRRHNPAPENPPPGMGPRPQRHRQPERTPRHDRYGAEGAPTPLMHPDEFFGPLPPSAGQDEDEEWRSKSPNQLYQELQALLESVRTAPTTNGGLNHGMSGAPTWHPENVQSKPGRFEPGQFLGKRGRQEHSSQQGESMYMPRQHAGQQEAEVQFGGPEQDIQEPGPKRRRMPGTEGQRAPPVPDPRARGVKKIRRVEQDAPLPPPPMNTHQPLSNPPQIPQPDVAVLTQPRYVYINGTPIDVGRPAQVPNSNPPQVPRPNRAVPTQPHYVYINGTPINVGGPAQVPNSLGTHLPPPPHPPHANQQHPVDMRDVRPSNGEQSQSLDQALRYTREAYRESTGQGAPVTNIEDSYNTQYREIRAVFRAWWKSEDNPRRLDPVPELWRMRRWSGTLEDWQAPEGREHLRDAVKRGKQVA